MGQHTGPFEVVRIADPAVDNSATINWKLYYAERDPKLLVMTTGQQPVVFHCTPLSVAERRAVRSLRDSRGESTSESKEMAFRLGVTRVSRLVHADGGPRDWVRPDDGSVGPRKPIPDTAMEDFGDSTLIDIGGVIEARSFLDRDQPLFCPLPDISLRVQTHLALHRAVLTKDSPPPSPSSSPPGDGSTPTVTPSSSPPGDASGGATATASPT